MSDFELVLSRDDFLKIVGESLEHAVTDDPYPGEDVPDEDVLDAFVEEVAIGATQVSLAAFGKFAVDGESCLLGQTVGTAEWNYYKDLFIGVYDRELRTIAGRKRGTVRIIET